MQTNYKVLYCLQFRRAVQNVRPKIGNDMNELFHKNEFETNEFVTKCIQFLLIFVFFMGVLCWVKVFDIESSMINGFIFASIPLLLLPTLLVNLLHIDRAWVKYFLIACVVLMTGIAYVVFTFQIVLIYIIPSILAAFYMDRKMNWFVGISTVMVIFLSHFVTGFFLFQPWIEPFQGLKAILLYGALPRILLYICCEILLAVMCTRFESYLISFNNVLQEEKQENTEKKRNDSYKEEANDTVDAEAMNQRMSDEHMTEVVIPKEKIEMKETQKKSEQLEAQLQKLTEREQEVFALLVTGNTNSQIASKLYLSVGTVKNYVSSIYDKTEERDRTALVLKYSPYYKDYDQSHT